MYNLKDKVAVVTGAGGTLCSVISVGLAQKGAKVLLVGRTAEKLEKTAEKIREIGGICSIATCDVTDESAMQKVANELKETWGNCEILVNGAGGNNNFATTSITEFSKDELSENVPEGVRGFFNIKNDAFESVLKINTMGTVIPCQIFSKQMVEAGGGSIVNFSSMNNYCPLTKNPSYAMSKAAITNFTKWLAAYLAPANIRVNAIAPGFFVNERTASLLGTPETGLKPRGKQVIDHTPMRRFGEPENLLGTLYYLIDDSASAFVTGITVPVDGGFLTLSGV